jgi:hypothetical protein
MKKTSYSTSQDRDLYPVNEDAKNDTTKVMESLESMGAPWGTALMEKTSMNKIAEELVKMAKEMVAEEVPGFDAAFRDFMDYCQKMRDDYYSQQFPNNAREPLDAMVGGRWIRIVTIQGHGGKSAWAFVDKTNGDVMKPAGWSAPAKHARANIFDRGSWKKVGPYGPAYLR